MQQFSLVCNNLFVFLEPVDEPRPTYACGQFMQGSSRGFNSYSLEDLTLYKIVYLFVLEASWFFLLLILSGKTQCKDNQMIDVAVVGAGIAGVYTAWKLAENYPDWTIHIYEANNRVGGRTYSIPLPKVTDFKADVGAMRFKKSLEPRLYRLGKELGLTIQPFNTPRDENTLHYLRSKLLTPRDLAKGNVPYEMTDDERIHAADESLYG